MGPRRVSLTRSRSVKDTLATISPQLDLPDVRERVLDVLRGLLEELGSHGAVVELSIDSNLDRDLGLGRDRKSTRLNSSHANISYAVFCLKKKTCTHRSAWS